MKAPHIPLTALIIWAAVSVAIFAIGVGFAGRISDVFTPPTGTDLTGAILWGASWIFITAPFPLLLLHFVRK
jgi:hypothetical protein